MTDVLVLCRQVRDAFEADQQSQASELQSSALLDARRLGESSAAVRQRLIGALLDLGSVGATPELLPVLVSEQASDFDFVATVLDCLCHGDVLVAVATVDMLRELFDIDVDDAPESERRHAQQLLACFPQRASLLDLLLSHYRRVKTGDELADDAAAAESALLAVLSLLAVLVALSDQLFDALLAAAPGSCLLLVAQMAATAAQPDAADAAASLLLDVVQRELRTAPPAAARFVGADAVRELLVLLGGLIAAALRGQPYSKDMLDYVADVLAVALLAAATRQCFVDLAGLDLLAVMVKSPALSRVALRVLDSALLDAPTCCQRLAADATTVDGLFAVLTARPHKLSESDVRALLGCLASLALWLDPPARQQFVDAWRDAELAALLGLFARCRTSVLAYDAANAQSLDDEDVGAVYLERLDVGLDRLQCAAIVLRMLHRHAGPALVAAIDAGLSSMGAAADELPLIIEEYLIFLDDNLRDRIARAQHILAVELHIANE